MSYRITRTDGESITAATLEGITDMLSQPQWPAGRYEVLEGHTASLPPGHMDRRYGVAIKDPDGIVIIDRDPFRQTPGPA